MALYAGITGPAARLMAFLTGLDGRHENIRRGHGVHDPYAGCIIVVTCRTGHHAVGTVAEHAVRVPASRNLGPGIGRQPVDSLVGRRLDVALAAPRQMLRLAPLLVYEEHA